MKAITIDTFTYPIDILKNHKRKCTKASPVAQMVKRLPAMRERPRFDPWVGKIPWRRKWQPTPVLLPGKFHGLKGSSEPGRLQSMGSHRVGHD